MAKEGTGAPNAPERFRRVRASSGRERFWVASWSTKESLRSLRRPTIIDSVSHLALIMSVRSVNTARRRPDSGDDAIHQRVVS